MHTPTRASSAQRASQQATNSNGSSTFLQRVDSVKSVLSNATPVMEVEPRTPAQLSSLLPFTPDPSRTPGSDIFVLETAGGLTFRPPTRSVFSPHGQRPNPLSVLSVGPDSPLRRMIPPIRSPMLASPSPLTRPSPRLSPTRPMMSEPCSPVKQTPKALTKTSSIASQRQLFDLLPQTESAVSKSAKSAALPMSLKSLVLGPNSSSRSHGSFNDSANASGRMSAILSMRSHNASQLVAQQQDSF